MWSCKSLKYSFFQSRMTFFVLKKFMSEEKFTLNDFVQEAERNIGYSLSFLNYPRILHDDEAAVTDYISTFMETNQSLLPIAKTILLQSEVPVWGLVILLTAKMAGVNNIVQNQKLLAKVTEMVKMSHMIHKEVINVERSKNSAASTACGNKLALLFGDYLLSKIFLDIACVRNSHVQERVFSAIRDLSESEFIGLRNNENNEPLPTKPLHVQRDVVIPLELGVEPFQFKHVMGHMKSEWTLRNILGGGSSLGKCCQSCLILADHDLHMQELGYSFGRNFALAWQASAEKILKEDKFSLVSAPVMLHLEYDPSFYSALEGFLEDYDNVDYNLIRKTVLEGPALEKTQNLQNKFVQNALKALQEFPECDSKNILEHLIKTI